MTNVTKRGPRATPLRSDARHNREQLLKVAVAAFAQDPDVSLEGIARAARVGIGTLYRHYPTRDALVEAAYRSKFEKLCASLGPLRAKHAPDVALARFFESFIEHLRSHQGMVQAMRAVMAGGYTPTGESITILSAAVAPLLAEGRAAGVLREDITVDDVIAAKGALATAHPGHARRMAALLLDGLRGPKASRPTRSRAVRTK
jgi:AcrR family transcriptional regulator